VTSLQVGRDYVYSGASAGEFSHTVSGASVGEFRCNCSW